MPKTLLFGQRFDMLLNNYSYQNSSARSAVKHSRLTLHYFKLGHVESGTDNISWPSTLSHWEVLARLQIYLHIMGSDTAEDHPGKAFLRRTHAHPSN
ncbi:hypothetical protein K461DRAFT_281978 [Myriangium duriaei CBS 260.36]|uniref:Uncharacterized protein n=1 Tax=Myriangium duriaei CBS 260.36 TaxID=1168546 RepID=A0A9P4MDV6_9PEZI|nr:hypothetical protein K461DRAFT_281978 [Myriangium duriaei CBS 260.36]